MPQMKKSRIIFFLILQALSVALLFLSCTSTETSKRAIDRRLQNLVDETLGDRSGSIVVMKASTKEIIASASNKRDENNLSPAGSLSYLAITDALLKNEKFNRDAIINCKGKSEINGCTVECNVYTGHGDVSLKEAFAQACDVYFAEAMQDCDSTALLESARKFNFTITDDVWLSVPYQGAEGSPLKMAQMMSDLCKDNSTAAKELKELLRYKVTDGNAKKQLDNGKIKIAGTIATSDPSDSSIKDRWNSWGVSYAPYDAALDEQIVVSVLIDENNEWEWYAPYATNIIVQGYFNNQTYEESCKELGFTQFTK